MDDGGGLNFAALRRHGLGVPQPPQTVETTSLITDVTGEPGSRGWRLNLPLVGRRIDFRAAGRHSARVRILRVGIVAAASLSLVLLSVFAVFNPFRHIKEALSAAGVGVEGTQITINAPKLSGFRDDGQPYNVTARAALQDITTPHIVQLLDIDAKLGMADHSTTRVTAAMAIYDSKLDNMKLSGAVRIVNPSGYDVRLKSANMNVKTGGFVSDGDVTVLIDGGTVTAERMEIGDDGHHVAFDGNVRSHINPSDAGSAAAPARVP
jgi:lipopolysaccharide export system protein LptC